MSKFMRKFKFMAKKFAAINFTAKNLTILNFTLEFTREFKFTATNSALNSSKIWSKNA